ncbi:CKLF factor, partial [Todus mexicanus]|nr:CKLF factor [Todus mexicanus]
LPLSEQVLALATFLCFLVSRARGAYSALAAMEMGITMLFFLLYLLQLDRKMSWLFWPLADVFNSVIASLFLLVVCLLAVAMKTNDGILAGGVLGFILLALCVVDAIVLYRKISFERPREENTPEQ